MYNEIKEIVNFVVRRLNGRGPVVVPARQVYLFATHLANELRLRFMGTWKDPAMDGKRILKIGQTLEHTDEIFKKIFLFNEMFFEKHDYGQYVKGIGASTTLHANPGEVYAVCAGKREIVYKGDPEKQYCYLPQYITDLKLEASLVLNHVFSGHRHGDAHAFIPLLLVNEDDTYCQPDNIVYGDFSPRMLGATHTRRYTVTGFGMTKFGSHRSHKSSVCEKHY
uniref:Anti_prolifrtn domain-containing protein n=1 Tax=Steinernema glaseri TaxID=37863 RepID=A0A1I7YES2_9BILA